MLEAASTDTGHRYVSRPWRRYALTPDGSGGTATRVPGPWPREIWAVVEHALGFVEETVPLANAFHSMPSISMFRMFTSHADAPQLAASRHQNEQLSDLQ
ncbi:hypothetical protein PMIN06_001340 [Paraphaeosphaeria minitans]